MRNTGRAVLIKDNQVLLMFRNNFGRVYFAIPGGKQDEGESLEDTVIRELKEETSIDCEVIELIASEVNKKNDRNHHLFAVKYLSGKPKLGDNVELQAMTKNPNNFYKPMWVNIDSALDQLLLPDELEPALKDYLRKYIKTAK